MSTQTTIQWTDLTDNIIIPTIGGWWCRMISEGCVYCYAAKQNQSDYFGGNHLPYAGKPPEMKLRTEIIDNWARQTKPKKHFVASMTDIFGDWVPSEWIFRFLDGMVAAPKQTFQLLTKRADLMQTSVIAYCRARGIAQLPPNIWGGVSVENQKRADERIPLLLRTPFTVRFLSVEPLLGPVDFERVCKANHEFNALTGKQGWLTVNNHIHWVIVGGESGPRARLCDAQWIRSIVKQCRMAGVACFVKQLGAHTGQTWSGPQVGLGEPVPIHHPKGGDPSEWPQDLRVRQFPKL